MAYADGLPVTAAPPSLRVYTMAKRLPGMFSGSDVLQMHHKLWAELACYAAEEARAANERAAREDARQRHQRGGRRIAGGRR